MIDPQRTPMEQRELHVDVHHENGAYWAEVRELPGCFASGATVAELVEAIEEAVALYLAPPEGEASAPLAVELAGFNLSLESDRPLQPA
jgi:predicted RNase H-like HicB family nuclease